MLEVRPIPAINGIRAFHVLYKNAPVAYFTDNDPAQNAFAKWHFTRLCDGSYVRSEYATAEDIQEFVLTLPVEEFVTAEKVLGLSDHCFFEIKTGFGTTVFVADDDPDMGGLCSVQRLYLRRDLALSQLHKKAVIKAIRDSLAEAGNWPVKISVIDGKNLTVVDAIEFDAPDNLTVWNG